MNDLYADCCIKRKQTTSVFMLKTLALFAVFVLLAATIFIRGIFGVVTALYVVFLIWYWPRFKVDIEYVFCDGQLDFDMILGGEKRKHVLRVEIEDAAVIAPLDSPKLDGYRHLKVKDFTSYKEGKKVYGMAISIKDEKVLLTFEPNEKMLEKMQMKQSDIVNI